MRVCKPEGKDTAPGAVALTAGPGFALLAVALLAAHVTELVDLPTVSLTAFLVWQIAWFNRHRTVQSTCGGRSATDSVGVLVERTVHSQRHVGRPSRKSCDRTV